jgi:hypothetical protein
MQQVEIRVNVTLTRIGPSGWMGLPLLILNKHPDT